MKLPIIPIEKQIEFIKHIDNCEETHSILYSLEVLLNNNKQAPEKPVTLCLSPEKARQYNDWDRERDRLLTKIKELETSLAN